jgi:hypothetical protein
MTKEEFKFRVLAEMEAVKEKKATFGYITNTSEEGELYGVQFTKDGEITQRGIRFYDDAYQFYGDGFCMNRWYSEVNSIMNANSLAGEFLVRIHHTLGTNITMFF